MGIRINIKVADLLNAGLVIFQTTEEYPADEHMAAMTIKTLSCKAGHDDVFVFDLHENNGVLWASADYNDWGTFKPRLAPVVAALNIPHILG